MVGYYASHYAMWMLGTFKHRLQTVITMVTAVTMSMVVTAITMTMLVTVWGIQQFIIIL